MFQNGVTFYVLSGTMVRSWRSDLLETILIKGLTSAFWLQHHHIKTNEVITNLALNWIPKLTSRCVLFVNRLTGYKRLKYSFCIATAAWHISTVPLNVTYVFVLFFVRTNGDSCWLVAPLYPRRLRIQPKTGCQTEPGLKSYDSQFL